MRITTLHFTALAACAAALLVAAAPAPDAAPASAAPDANAAAAGQATNGVRFPFAPGHFSFDLPAYWTVVPTNKLEQYREQAGLATGRSGPAYALAIQRKALLSFAMPYVLFEIGRGRQPSGKELIAEASSFQVVVARAYLPLHRAGAYGEINVQNGVYDPEKHAVIGYYEMLRASDKKRIAAYIVTFACRYGYVRLHCFLPADEKDVHLPVIAGIVDSFAFDPGYGYDVSAPEKRRRGLGQLVWILVPLLALWLVMRIGVRRMQAARRARPDASSWGTRPRGPGAP